MKLLYHLIVIENKEILSVIENIPNLVDKYIVGGISSINFDFESSAGRHGVSKPHKQGRLWAEAGWVGLLAIVYRLRSATITIYIL